VAHGGRGEADAVHFEALGFAAVAAAGGGGFGEKFELGSLDHDLLREVAFGFGGGVGRELRVLLRGGEERVQFFAVARPHAFLFFVILIGGLSLAHLYIVGDRF
jgi:hypothetical protein